MNNACRKEIKDLVVEVTAQVFSLNKNIINESLKIGDRQEWDSLGQIKLFLALENKFKIKFSTQDIMQTDSIEKIIHKVMEFLL
jgi:acyl carrier protein